MPFNRDKTQAQPLFVTAPGVPASGTPVVNNTGSDVTVYIVAGTLTAVTLVDGAGTSHQVSNAGANQSFDLPVNWSITLTYSVAPTWFWSQY